MKHVPPECFTSKSPPVLGPVPTWKGVCSDEMSAPKAVEKAKTKPVNVQQNTTIQDPKFTCAMDTVCMKVVT